MNTDSPSSFPAQMRFRHPWRPYQRRILDELESHVDDRHFHIIAAPGSGKTVLGLEVIRRMNRPALVLVPTLGIRGQWIRRFVDDFLHGRHPDWISTDLNQPGLLTVATYQSLSFFEKKRRAAELAEILDRANVSTLVFDEAHHLRNQWWKSLFELKKALKNPFVVALTATPPYDVTQVEWNRYSAICGPVDEEVSVPELVLAANLCPHQDYVYCTRPTDAEAEKLRRHSALVKSFLRDLALNETVIAAVAAHPALAQPEARTNDLLERRDYFLSLAVFLKHATGVAPEGLLREFGLEQESIPALDAGWAEILLNGLLFHDRANFAAHAEALDELVRILRAMGAIHRHAVRLRLAAEHGGLLRSSPAKLKGIADIVELESRHLQWRLRAVILTDYIREEAFPARDGAERQFTRLGAVPIFEHLRKLRLPEARLGILTGRLTVLPAETLPALRRLAAGLGVSGEFIESQPLWHDDRYVVIKALDTVPMLELATRLFSEGEVNVLIGTAALLGEGWDAPAVNTLILATVIGSYVSSNQMRGRAIRVDPATPHKTANVWHLACLNPEAAPSETFAPEQDEDELLAEAESDDFTLLRRRFQAFVGPSTLEQSIESGLDRLDISKLVEGGGEESANARMCRLAGDRDGMARRWSAALRHEQITSRRVMQEVFVPAGRVPSLPVFRFGMKSGNRWLAWLSRLILARKSKQAGNAVLEALHETGALKAPRGELAVRVVAGGEHIRARLDGAGYRDESVFIEALRQVFDPLSSPRYLLAGSRGKFAVPALLDANKVSARIFHSIWRRHVGRTRLVYVHSADGKRELLRFKEQFLAAGLRHLPRTRLRWF